MGKIKCIIIDDPYSASILEVFISELATLERIGTFSNPVDGLMFLHHSNVDLLFINTRFPDITGIEFLKLVPGRPKVIFLHEQGRRWTGTRGDQVLGCMQKPLRYEDFLEKVHLCQQCIPPAMRRASATEGYRDRRTGERFMYFQSGKALIKVLLKDILYVESVKNYGRIRTGSRYIEVGQGMAEIQSRLPEKDFLRIHRSFLVARDKITSFNESSVEINQCILPVAEQYRGKVMKLLRLGKRDL